MFFLLILKNIPIFINLYILLKSFLIKFIYLLKSIKFSINIIRNPFKS